MQTEANVDNALELKYLVRNNLRRLQTLVTKKDAQCLECTPMQGRGVRIPGILRELQLILIYIEVGQMTSLEIVNRGIIAILIY